MSFAHIALGKSELSLRCMSFAGMAMHRGDDCCSAVTSCIAFADLMLAVDTGTINLAMTYLSRILKGQTLDDLPRPVFDRDSMHAVLDKGSEVHEPAFVTEVGNLRSLSESSGVPSGCSSVKVSLW